MLKVDLNLFHGVKITIVVVYQINRRPCQEKAIRTATFNDVGD